MDLSMTFNPDDPRDPLHVYLDMLKEKGFSRRRNLVDNKKPFLEATGIYIDVNGPQYRADMAQALKTRWPIVQGIGEPEKYSSLLFSLESLARGDIHVASTMYAIGEAYDGVRVIEYKNFPHSNGSALILYRGKRKKAHDFIRKQTRCMFGTVSFR